MALAELKNDPSLLLIQVFRPAQEKKHHLPHWERNWGELGSFACVLFASRKPANQVIPVMATWFIRSKNWLFETQKNLCPLLAT